MKSLLPVGAALAGGWYVWQRVISMTTVPLFADLVVALARPEPGMDVYDPSAGIGMLLAAADRRARTSHGRASTAGSGTRLYGQELDTLSYAIGRAHLGARSLEVQYARGDTLRAPAFVESGRLRRFDRVVANPVWEQAVPTDVFEQDPYGRFAFGAPPRECADWGWMQHALASLHTGGRMAVVLDAGALSRSASVLSGSSELEIRRQFIESDLVEAVIWCGNDQSYTGVDRMDRVVAPRLSQSAIIVATRERRQPGRVLMIDPAPVLRRHLRRPSTALKDIVEVHERFTDVPGIASVVETDRIIRSECDLRPARYLAPSG